jgi:hypothetical protein
MIHVINRQTRERRDNIFTMLVRKKEGKSKDDNDSDDNSDYKEDNLSDEELKSKKGKWWEFFKKSDE